VVSSLEKNIPANLWDMFRTKFLQVTPEQAKQWLITLAERARDQLLFDTQSPWRVSVPELNFEQLPASVIESFRQGEWRTVLSTDELPTASAFSVFSFLPLLPGSPRGGTPIDSGRRGFV
jgi:hypothetical protein